VVPKENVYPKRRVSIPPAPAAVGYAATQMKHNFDLTWLSALTISHVGNMRMDESLNAWLRHRESTFLNLVPAYYARSRLLQCVVDSILAKASYVLCPSPKTRKSSLRMYGQALKEVQTALLDREAAKSTEMLCAIRMLQIYELLEVTVPEERAIEMSAVQEAPAPSLEERDEADSPWDGWRITGTQSIGSHTQGMQILVKMRKPSSFKTEMDKSLLCSLLENFVRVTTDIP
jgi:hypothetical protein